MILQCSMFNLDDDLAFLFLQLEEQALQGRFTFLLVTCVLSDLLAGWCYRLGCSGRARCL